jgi:hypothetical protein
MNRSTLLPAALDAAERGWHVFPLRPNDKRPAFPDHTAERCTGRDPRCHNAGSHVGWQARSTTDPVRIRRAWTTAPYNVGIATGPSGLIVVDLDTPKPGQETPPAQWAGDGVHDGADVFARVCQSAGQPVPVHTHTATTGRGGTHLYYRHPTTGQRLGNTAGTLGWLIDTRAWGGYVVAAGSVVAGKPYTRTRDGEPAQLPGWLGERLQPAPLPPQQPVQIALGTGRRAAYLNVAIARQVDAVALAPGGHRNRALFQSACALGQLVAGGELTHTDVTDVLTDAARRAGLSSAETARTITSGLRAGANRPRSVAA